MGIGTLPVEWRSGRWTGLMVGVLRPRYRAVYRAGPAFADRAIPAWDKVLKEDDFVLLVHGELLPSLPARLVSWRKSGETVPSRVAAE